LSLRAEGAAIQKNVSAAAPSFWIAYSNDGLMGKDKKWGAGEHRLPAGGKKINRRKTP